MDWENDLAVDEFLVIEAYRKLDPEHIQMYIMIYI